MYGERATGPGLTRRDFLRLSGATLAGAYALGLVVGCGGGGGAKQLRMTWWGSQPLHKATRKAVDLLERKNEGLSITPIPSGYEGYFDKLATQGVGGNAPDVMMFDKWFLPQFAERGALMKLGEFVPDVIETNGIDERILGQSEVNGKLYGVASGVNSYALSYDAAVLDDVGVEMPGNDWTWDDFTELAAEISKAKGEGYWGTEDGAWGQQPLEVFVRQRGGELFDERGQLGFAKEDLAEWWTYWRDLRESGAAPPPDVTAAAQTSGSTPLIEGKAAMQPTSFSDLFADLQGMTEHELGIHLLPNGPEGTRPGQYLNAVRFMCGYARSQQPEEVTKTINALVNDVAIGKVFGVLRGAPASQKVHEAVEQEATGLSQAIFDYHETVRQNSSPPPPPLPLRAGEVVELYVRASQDVAFKKTTVDGGVGQFFSQARRILGS